MGIRIISIRHDERSTLRSKEVFREFAIGLLFVASLMTPSMAQSQQRQIIVVTMLSEDSAAIEARRVAIKDLVSELKSQSSGTGSAPIILVKKCQKVPAAAIQNLTKELMAQKFSCTRQAACSISGVTAP